MTATSPPDRSPPPATTSFPQDASPTFHTKQKSEHKLIGIVKKLDSHNRDRGTPASWLYRWSWRFVVVALTVYSYYVVVGRLCAPMLQRRENARGSVGAGVGILIAETILYLMFYWTYLKAMLTSPGRAPEEVPHIEPTIGPAPITPEASAQMQPYPLSHQPQNPFSNTQYEQEMQPNGQVGNEERGGFTSEAGPLDAARNLLPSELSFPGLNPNSNPSPPPHHRQHRSSGGSGSLGSDGTLYDQHYRRYGSSPEGAEGNGNGYGITQSLTMDSTTPLRTTSRSPPRGTPQVPEEYQLNPPTTSAAIKQQYELQSQSQSQYLGHQQQQQKQQHSHPPSWNPPPPGMQVYQPHLHSDGLHDLKERPLQPVQTDLAYCRYCRIYKPDRAHHCRVCGICTLGMDHDCPWVNCIGWRNHKFFINFLLWSSIYTLFVLIILICYMLGNDQTDGQMIAMAAISGFFTFFTLSMLLSHIGLVITAMTTIESFSLRNQRDRERAMLQQKFGFCGWRQKRKTTKGWKRDYGDLSSEGNRWYVGGAMVEWKRVMGDNWIWWILPIGRSKGDGIHFDQNPRFGPDGQRRKRPEWPEHLR